MNDVLFKFVFGKEERKNITIDFLNAVLEESLEHPIKDIRFMQTEQVPQNDGGKLTRFDVACELDSGEIIGNAGWPTSPISSTIRKGRNWP